jgi:hypothetical protein
MRLSLARPVGMGSSLARFGVALFCLVPRRGGHILAQGNALGTRNATNRTSRDRAKQSRAPSVFPQLCRPFRAGSYHCSTSSPGRCPGLICCGPFGASPARAQHQNWRVGLIQVYRWRVGLAFVFRWRVGLARDSSPASGLVFAAKADWASRPALLRIIAQFLRFVQIHGADFPENGGLTMLMRDIPRQVRAHREVQQDSSSIGRRALPIVRLSPSVMQLS